MTPNLRRYPRDRKSGLAGKIAGIIAGIGEIIIFFIE